MSYKKKSSSQPPDNNKEVLVGRSLELYLVKPKPHLANGPWKKSLNFILPTKYGIPKSSKG